MNTETKAPEQPSKDQIITWYKDQIEVATLRRDLSALQAEIAKNEAQRVQATILLAQMQDPASQNKNEVEHVVTQEDLDANPEFVNSDPYGKGWMIKVKIQDSNEASNLLDAEAYEALIG